MSERSIRLQPGQTAIVGYGSLLSLSSISRTLGRAYDGPFVHAHLAGWRRTWDVAMPNEAFYFVDHGERVYPRRILYLNLRQAPGAIINVALFVVDPHELRAMQHREWIYDPRVVTADLRGLRVTGGDAIVYVGRPEHVVAAIADRRDAAVRASYVRLLERTLAGEDAAFCSEYERTTEPVPDLVIDDVLDPERPDPWAKAPPNR